MIIILVTFFNGCLCLLGKHFMTNFSISDDFINSHSPIYQEKIVENKNDVSENIV